MITLGFAPDWLKKNCVGCDWSESECVAWVYEDGEWEVFVGKATLHLFATPRTTSQAVTS